MRMKSILTYAVALGLASSAYASECTDSIEENNIETIHCSSCGIAPAPDGDPNNPVFPPDYEIAQIIEMQSQTGGLSGELAAGMTIAIISPAGISIVTIASIDPDNGMVTVQGEQFCQTEEEDEEESDDNGAGAGGEGGGTGGGTGGDSISGDFPIWINDMCINCTVHTGWTDSNETETETETD